MKTVYNKHLPTFYCKQAAMFTKVLKPRFTSYSLGRARFQLTV